MRRFLELRDFANRREFAVAIRPKIPRVDARLRALVASTHGVRRRASRCIGSAVQGKAIVPGLSIIVPAGDAVSHFEDTFAAVLRNRPRACEVIVPHAGYYADPYELASEVWFIELAAQATLEECLAHAIDKASGDVVHVLSPGCDFDDGWYQPAVAMFDDASVGC